MIPVIRLWGCENSFSNRENFSLFSNFIFCCWLWCLARTSLHKNKPNESDLIGIYEPDAKTQKLILKDGGYSSAKCRIELNADGKIEFTNMPDWWQGGSGESHKQLISTNGTWNLEKVEDRWQIVWDDNKAFDFNLHLMGQKPPYKIFIYIGDPDSNLFMIFDQLASP